MTTHSEKELTDVTRAVFLISVAIGLLLLFINMLLPTQCSENNADNNINDSALMPLP